jgi:hypothetical protein
MAIKHIGKLKSNSRKVAVVYRTLPGDPYSALIVGTESLTDSEHDILMNMIEGPVGQNAGELAEAMARTTLSDGSIMLARFHALNKLQKVATNQVIMTPNTTTNVPLDELNQIIAEQKGVALEDLAIKDTSSAPTTTATTETTATLPTGEAAPTGEQALSDEDLAKSYRSQADAMFKEAQRLRKEAEALSPTKKSAKA